MSGFRTLALALAVTASIAGCSATRGAIGGLIPAPKFTKGTLSDGSYTAKDKSFSVAVPFPPGTPGYTYMEIAEKYEAGESQVVFSSSVHPAEVYRVATFPDVKAEERLAEVSVATYRKDLEASSSAPFREEKATPELIDGILSIPHRFSQTIPERSADGHRYKGFVAIHSTHFLQRSSRAAFIAINRMPDGSAPRAEGGEARIAAFLKSFRLR